MTNYIFKDFAEAMIKIRNLNPYGLSTDDLKDAIRVNEIDISSIKDIYVDDGNIISHSLSGTKSVFSEGCKTIDMDFTLTDGSRIIFFIYNSGKNSGKYRRVIEGSSNDTMIDTDIMEFTEEELLMLKMTV